MGTRAERVIANGDELIGVILLAIENHKQQKNKDVKMTEVIYALMVTLKASIEQGFEQEQLPSLVRLLSISLEMNLGDMLSNLDVEDKQT